MNRLEFAERRYRQLLPQPRPGAFALPVRELLVWLKDDVCPVVEEYARRPSFRRHATWPLRTLLPGSGSQERGLLEATDHSLVDCAQQLLALAQQKGVARQLARLWPPRPMLTGETVTITGQSVQRSACQETLQDGLTLSTLTVQWIARRGWKDLVCPADYLEPRGGWMARSGDNATAGEFVVSFNPELHGLGDFVSRCLLRRIRILCEVLGDFRTRCAAAARAAGSRAAKALQREEQAFQRLRADAEALERACLASPEASLRDSCIVLTQAYAAFGVKPDVDWLGLPAADVQSGAATIRHRLTHEQHPELSERIALALGDLHRLYDGASPEQSQREEAIGSGGLVLFHHPRQIYWEGRLIDVAWARYRVLWRFLEELVRRARRQGPVHERDLYPESGAASKMATNVSRLRTLLPASLWKSIEPIPGERAYHLRLPADHIFLF